MAIAQQLYPSETITRAEDKLLELSMVIFREVRLSRVEQLVWKAAQINLGLFALTILTPDKDAYWQVITGLNSLINTSESWP